ncbi:putative RNA-binding protein YlmH [Vitis riparia]|uniref:putative RNA-binding protein YlmH n=1 Tax=Vitis riparia TaxID=96939 RepID=UPI00155A3D90|nr:putative RNA-binding protein YlmH [Vitis riparia]
MAATGFTTPSVLRKALHSFLPLRLTHINNTLFCYKNLRSFPLSTHLNSSASGMCHLAQAMKGDANSLLKGVADRSTIEAVKHILEMAKRASARREVLHTDFLTPPVLKESMIVLEKLADMKAVAQGGYPQAERCRLSVGHSEVLTTAPDIVAALRITGNFGFQSCSHGDFLGAILGTGIAREKLGDIILQGEKGAQVLIVPELVDFLVSSLEKVGNVSVSCTKMPLLALEYEEPRTTTFKTIELSLRVDALASAGFKLSRSKLVDLISNGDVRVNWTTVTKNGTTLKTGDVVSVSGKGRLKIGEINSTKKGKYAVELIRFL